MSQAIGMCVERPMCRPMRSMVLRGCLWLQLALEVKNQTIAGSSADATEGRMAFVEKRKAEFKGV